MLTKIHSTATTLRRRSDRQRGFTIVEMMVAMLLLSIVLAAVYAVWFGLQRTYAFTEDDMRAQEQARAALGEMVELIRTARMPEVAPWEALRATIAYADDTTLLFWSDADRDASHDLELIRYRVDTDASVRTLYRDTWQVSGASFLSASSVRLVSRWVSNSTGERALFAYKDANGEALGTTALGYVANPMNIRTITISLKIDVQLEKSPIAHELTSVVQPRNMR